MRLPLEKSCMENTVFKSRRPSIVDYKTDNKFTAQSKFHSSIIILIWFMSLISLFMALNFYLDFSYFKPSITGSSCRLKKIRFQLMETGKFLLGYLPAACIQVNT